MQPKSKESKTGSIDQEISPSSGKNAGVFFAPCRARKCVSTAISGDVDVSEVAWCHFLQQMSSQWGSQKFYQELVSHELIGYFFTFDLLSTQFIMAILSKECKPDNFQSHNSLTLSFMNIRGFCSNFIEYESFLESNSPEILALCETNLDDSIDSGNFSVRGYLPLTWKDSITHVWSCSLCEGRTSFCMGLISLENSEDS